MMRAYPVIRWVLFCPRGAEEKDAWDVVKQIRLSGGEEALVDDNDFEYLSQRHWRADYPEGGGGPYVVCTIKRDGETREVSMHRVLARAKRGQIVEHLNRNTLDNQRDNLHIVDATELRFRIPVTREEVGRNGYRGIIQEDGGKHLWNVRIKAYGKEYVWGDYDTAEEAARAYDTFVLRVFGPNAGTNVAAFPELGTEAEFPPN